MTPSTVRPAHSLPDSPGFVGRMSGLVRRVVDIAARVPDSAIALLGRFSIAAVFWKSGQTKIEGFAADFVAGEFSFGWPRLSDSAVALFQGEYQAAADSAGSRRPDGRVCRSSPPAAASGWGLLATIKIRFT